MLIHISGATGAGKTYVATKYFTLDNWYHSEDVYSNIDLYVSKYKKWIFKKPKNPGTIYRFEHIEDTYHLENCTVLFDDAGKVFNSKRWAEISLEFADKLQTHRHDKLKFISTSPSIKRIYNEFRLLVHRWYYVEKVFQIGTEDKNFLSLHRYCELDIDQIETAETDKMADRVSRYKYFILGLWSKRYYDTHAQIKSHKYKQIWTKLNNQEQLVICPNTMSLKDALSLQRSLKSGFTLNRQK